MANNMKTLPPLSDSLPIPSRDVNPTEFEVQAFIFSELKKSSVDVRGEVSYKDYRTRKFYRFDLVIYKDNMPVEIVEVKANLVKHRNGVENTRQAKKYRQFGVKVTFVYGMSDAAKFITERT